jgi:hypothetical protein
MLSGGDADNRGRRWAEDMEQAPRNQPRGKEKKKKKKKKNSAQPFGNQGNSKKT